jgi:hypothetical protein
MKAIIGACILFAMVPAAFAKTVNLGGTVSNAKGNPIAGAVVKLASQNLADTTDSKGAYSLVHSDVAVGSAPLTPSVEKVSFDRGILRLALTGRSRVRIDLHDMRGALLERAIDRDAGAGEYRFNLAAGPLACRMMVVRVWIGGNASAFRYLPLDAVNGAITAGVFPFSVVDRSLEKTTAAVDSLSVAAAGFTTKTVKIASYQTTVNVTLDSNTSSLEKFSFFITSLKALQQLSGNTKGFGGDFRFGKTGHGAGLLGADSICQCIAEKSMPGSKVKQWRAFLSADSAGANGAAVNAIDRIGQGPWYDRLGRVVSPNLQGLLATRPNADAAIKNDLPNEDGIPNHRPDPNAGTVDNHHMVTASNTSGKLSGNTCNDWTSKVDVSGGRNGGPLCGFAWPRSMAKVEGGNASHWISGFTASGCSPSVEAQTMVGIGGGGGYGGFYCFALTP